MGETLTRRGLLSAAPAAGLAAVGAPAAAQDTAPGAQALNATCADAPLLRGTPLRDLAAPKGVTIGSTMLVERIEPEHPGYAPRFTDLVVRDCQIVSTENDFKIHRLVNLQQDGATRPAIRWNRVDQFVAYFLDRDVRVHGHTLVWNRFLTDRHFFRTLSAKDCRAFMEWYVETVVGRFAGRVASWDVVNEPTTPGRWPNKAYREGPYLAAYGGGYIAEAYKRARAADPDATLVLNEFGFAWGERWTDEVRANFLRILDDALDAGAPIDAVGMQSHLRMHDHLAEDQYLAFVDALRAREVEVMITELDVAEEPSDLSIDERDAQMANFVAAFLDPLLRDYGVRTIITWGLSDLHTYEYRDVVRKMPDPEFRPRPSWYDTDLRPKPVRDRVAALLADL